MFANNTTSIAASVRNRQEVPAHLRCSAIAASTHQQCTNRSCVSGMCRVHATSSDCEWLQTTNADVRARTPVLLGEKKRNRVHASVHV